MSTLVVGDMHLKHRHVLPAVDSLLERDATVARVVFLGDSCDDWGARVADELAAMDCFAQWVSDKRDAGLQVDVLLGNHDFCYIRGRRGPGSVMHAMLDLRRLLEFPLDARMACAVGPYLCTHAGVTGIWASRHLAGVDDAPDALADALNGMLADSDFWEALDSCPPSRGGWSLPGPLWADLRDLVDDPLDGVPQIVGHTPVERCADFSAFCPGLADSRLWACDTLSLSSGGSALGDGSMLLVDDDGAAEVVEFPGGEPYAEAAARYWRIGA